MGSRKRSNPDGVRSRDAALRYGFHLAQMCEEEDPDARPEQHGGPCGHGERAKWEDFHLDDVETKGDI